MKEDCTILDWFSAILFDCSTGLKNDWYLQYWLSGMILYQIVIVERNRNFIALILSYSSNRLLMFCISSDILWVSNTLPSLYRLFKILLKIHGWKIGDVCHVSKSIGYVYSVHIMIAFYMIYLANCDIFLFKGLDFILLATIWIVWRFGGEFMS